MIYKVDGESAAEHNGSWDGTSTEARFYLERDRALLVLCNDGSCDVAALLNDVDCAVEGGLEKDGDDEGDDDEWEDDDDDEEEEEEGICSGDVVHLTKKTFHATVSAAPFALVDFYATWYRFQLPRPSPVVIIPPPLPPKVRALQAVGAQVGHSCPSAQR